MDATHLHLILTHFPIVGTCIGIGILAFGLVLKNTSLQITAYTIFFAMALLTIPVFLTGEQAEETVEHMAGVSEQLIENHEELAEKAIWLMGFLGIISLAGIIVQLKKSRFSKLISILILVISLGTFGLFAKVGNLGGQIRHTEIRTSGGNNQENINITIESDHEEDED